MALLSTAAAAMSLFAVYCNTAFYPRLLQFQAGYSAARIINSEFPDRRAATTETDHLLDFYLPAGLGRITSPAEARGLSRDHILFVGNEFKQGLESAAIPFEVIRELDDFRVTRLTLDFLNPSTRQKVVERKYLLVLR